MLIAEEFLLLCLDDETGKKRIEGDRIDPALTAALLVELALLERVRVGPKDAPRKERGRVRVVSDTPTGEAELDGLLQRLQERDGKKVSELVSQMSFRPIVKNVRGRLLERLGEAGILGEARSRFLKLKQYPTTDPEPEQEVRSRLAGALRAGHPPSERTVALVALLEATGLLTKVMASDSRDDKKALRARAKQLTEGDWAGAAVKHAIDEMIAVAATAAVGAGAAGGSGG